MGSTLIGTQFSGGSYSYVRFGVRPLPDEVRRRPGWTTPISPAVTSCEVDPRGCDLLPAVVSAAQTGQS